MMQSREAALTEARARRKALQDTAMTLKGRISPIQLAEDALQSVDPDQAILGRIRERIGHNRFLSLAVLAGAGWLFVDPTRKAWNRGDKSADGTAQTPTKAKEKNDDSRQGYRKQWNGTVHGGAEPRFENVKPPENHGGQTLEEGQRPLDGFAEAQRRGA